MSLLIHKDESMHSTAISPKQAPSTIISASVEECSEDRYCKSVD